MPTLFIANMAVVVPIRFKGGDILDDIAARVLNDIQRRRVRAKLAYLIDRGGISPEELQAYANRFMEDEMEATTTSEDDDAEDPVFEEALSIAREIIVRRMAEQGLPPPRGLDLHAKALVDGRPELQEQARKRIEARYKAATESLNLA